MSTLDQRFAEAMGAALGPAFPSEIALAVSGGGDSMAMLTLAHNWTHRWGVRLRIVTVDHGLRPEAAQEAALVRATCDELGHPHDILHWHWDGQGNLMDAARRGRLTVIGDWLQGTRHLLLAHTRDDVAETFLMRLARGSGVDGLSAMAPLRDIARPDGSSFSVLRPCLDMGREELRHYLRTLKGTWVEDPSNQDDRYERARLRKLLATLGGYGLDAATLAQTANRMSRSADALRQRAAEAWTRIGTEDSAAATLSFERDSFAALDRDTQARLLAAALQFVAQASYRPRSAALESLLDRLLAGGAGTLHGCEARCGRTNLRIFREYAAVAATRTPAAAGLWDGKWLISHPDCADLTVRALGDDGWRQAETAREHGPAHAISRGLPSLWRGDRLVACDALNLGPGGTATLVPGARGFAGFLLSR
ncbi:tRNA lysidine(34) synthetase TilS [Citreicella sp. C3M06]|uniref:tRNA lysidine(34) synthetase TilS n=1 Tax=Citreicella sp. C3M06 TaxID=2841564 RepID=UPI00352E089F